MRALVRGCRGIAAAAMLIGTTAAGSTPPPEATSLNTCQKQVRTAAKTYVDGYIYAVATCLQAVSMQVIQKNAADAHVAASTCVTQFRRIYDSRGLGKSLADKLSASIEKKCAPGIPNVTHTLEDILGPGTGVPQAIEAEGIGAWCANFGGSGSITTLQQWTDCVAAAHACDAQVAISTQYPRALEWLAKARSAMDALPRPTRGDTTRIDDAIAGLDQVVAAMDPGHIGRLSFHCGGNNRLLKTGQTTSLAPGDDGAVQAGVALSYLDNHDGTITDLNTGLMWEKKVMWDGTQDPANLHDADNGYQWAGDCSSERTCYNGGTCCQTSEDCVSPHTCTITDYQGTNLTIFGWVPG